MIGAKSADEAAAVSLVNDLDLEVESPSGQVFKGNHFGGGQSITGGTADDTNNVEMACRFWNLRSTDIMQGVVYGTRIEDMSDDPRMATRFDFDQCFGTAINRFCAMAVLGIPPVEDSPL